MEPNVPSSPIPRAFWSLEKDRPFDACSLCERPLREAGVPYLIEKAVRRDEPIFEYAMCLDCQAKLYDELSPQSLRRVHHYFDERVDLERRYLDCLRRFGPDPQAWLERCLIKDTPKNQCEEYQIYGYFEGDKLIFNGAPFLLSSEVIEELLPLLSDETLGTLNDFSDRLFGIDLPQSLIFI